MAVSLRALDGALEPREPSGSAGIAAGIEESRNMGKLGSGRNEQQGEQRAECGFRKVGEDPIYQSSIPYLISKVLQLNTDENMSVVPSTTQPICALLHPLGRQKLIFTLDTKLESRCPPA